jgi:hypothetical protein
MPYRPPIPPAAPAAPPNAPTAGGMTLLSLTQLAQKCIRCIRLELNHLLFNAAEDPSPFLQSQTQLCRNICEALPLNYRRTLHCDRLAGNHRFRPDNELHGCALPSSRDTPPLPTL